MLGRVLSGPALFLMERGAEDGFSGSKEAGLIRGGFFSGKRKSAFPEKMERRGDRVQGRGPELVYVPLVTAVLFHIRHICRGFLRSFMAPGLDDFMKGVVHILRHAEASPQT